jgi:hypothetical protein
MSQAKCKIPTPKNTSSYFASAYIWRGSGILLARKAKFFNFFAIFLKRLFKNLFLMYILPLFKGFAFQVRGGGALGALLGLKSSRLYHLGHVYCAPRRVALLIRTA